QLDRTVALTASGLTPSGQASALPGLYRLWLRPRSLGRIVGLTSRPIRARPLRRRRATRRFQLPALLTATAHRPLLSRRFRTASHWLPARAGTRRPRRRAMRAALRAAGATRRTRTVPRSKD